MGYIFGILIFLLLLVVTVFIISPKIQSDTVRKTVKTLSSAIFGGFAAILFFTGGWSYADPGYLYQVRTITGTVYMAGANSGWYWSGFGKSVPWPKAISVEHDASDSEKDEDAGSQYPYSIRMLDRVDGKVTQTTRFRIPTDEKTFLIMAEEYRSPENLLRTELIPTVEQVLNASASLMGAEDYFNGQNNQLQIDFDYQMRNGIYTVERKEVKVASGMGERKGTANATKGTEQEEYGDDIQVRWVVEKLKNKEGQFLTRVHNYPRFGISVIDAKFKSFEPNAQFVKRMEQQQKASADRAIAREQKIQEEEQKQLAIVKGEREIAEEQAKVKKEQIQVTTKAETEKQLALTNAEKIKEQARIEKEAAAVQLDRDRLIAQSQKVLADAEAYQKQAVIEADNALDKKLQAEIEIQKVWAEAFAKRNVPSTIIGGSGQAGGTDGDAKAFMQLLTIDAAKRLNYDREVNKK